MDGGCYWLEAAAVKKLPISVMLVPELVKIGPTVQGPMKSWAMATTTRAQHMGKKQTVQ